MLSADFFKINLFREISYRNTIRSSYGLDGDQGCLSFGPDLILAHLQRLTADALSRC